MNLFFTPAPDEHQKREKSKARELRASQWWRQQVGPGLCHYCRQKFSASALTMDHLLPIIRGGKTSKKNCVPCCKECNNRKGNRLAAEYIEELESAKSSTPSE